MGSLAELAGMCAVGDGAALAPRVAEQVRLTSGGDSELAIGLAQLLSPAQRRGDDVLSDPLGMPAEVAAAEVEPLSGAQRRALLFAALAVGQSPAEVIGASGVDIDTILYGPVDETVSVSEGIVQFRREKTRAAVVQRAHAHEIAQAHADLARTARTAGAADHALWHAALGPPSTRRAVRPSQLTSLASRFLLRGRAEDACRLAALAAQRSVGDEQRRARGVAAEAAFWCGQFGSARADFTAILAAAAEGQGQRAAAFLEAMDRHDELPDGEVYSHERAVGIFRLLASLTSSTRTKNAMQLLARVCDALYRDPEGADALHAHLLLTSVDREDARRRHAVPLMPLAQAHVLLMQAAFLIEFGDLAAAGRVLARGVPTLPLERPTAGIVSSLIRQAAPASNELSGAVADAYDALRGSALEFRPLGTGAGRRVSTVTDDRGAPAGRPVTANLPDSLTPRQREVIGRLVQGASNREIATALGISERTVEVHLATIYRKLDVSSRVELVAQLLGQRLRAPQQNRPTAR